MRSVSDVEVQPCSITFVYPITSSGVIALDATETVIYAVTASGLTVMTLPHSVDQITPTAWPDFGRLKTSSTPYSSNPKRLAMTRKASNFRADH